MKKMLLGLMAVCALSITTGCSTGTAMSTGKDRTTQGGNVIATESAGSASLSTQRGVSSQTSNTMSNVNTVRDKVKFNPTADGAITCETFVDPMHGWVVIGQDILATNDGGKMWSKISTVKGSIRDIGFVSLTDGWLFTGSNLKKTVDGGRTWRTETVPQAPGITLEQAQFIDSQHGWIMGTGEGKFIPDPKHPGSGQIPSIVIFWSTADGGKSWTRINVPTQIANNEFEGSCDFSFVSTEQGFLLMGTQPGTGAQGKSLYRTVDGGQHWTKVTSIGFYASKPKHGLPGGGYISGLDFLNTRVGWLSEARGPVYVTTDGGQIWNALPSNRLHDMTDVHFTDAKHGFAIYRNVLFATSDGGITWQRLYPGPWPTMFTSTQFFNSLDGISAGTLMGARAILQTTDGGYTWRQIASVPGHGAIIALSFPDPQHGWVITDEYSGNPSDSIQRTIYKTTDGGHTWKAVARTTKQKDLFTQLSFINSRTGFVASGWGHLFVTHDGGTTLTVVDNKDSDASQLQFVNSTNGWKIMNHHLYSTSDGGQSWHMLPLNYMVINFDMVNADIAWVIAHREFNSQAATNVQQSSDAYAPLLLSTANGGHSWTLHDLRKMHAASVTFSDSKHGWLLDDHGGHYHTNDGGQTWTQVNLLALGP